MSKDKQKVVDYEALKSELDEVLESLQRDDLGVDKSLEYYRRGLELTQQLESYLKDAGNKINELKAKFNTGAT